MSMNRRRWLKTAAGAGVGLAAGALGVEAPELHAATKKEKLEGVEEITSACNLCACGCGMTCHVKDGKLVNLEGDTDHVIKRERYAPRVRRAPAECPQAFSHV